MFFRYWVVKKNEICDTLICNLLSVCVLGGRKILELRKNVLAESANFGNFGTFSARFAANSEIRSMAHGFCTRCTPPSPPSQDSHSLTVSLHSLPLD